MTKVISTGVLNQVLIEWFIHAFKYSDIFDENKWIEHEFVYFENLDITSKGTASFILVITKFHCIIHLYFVSNSFGKVYY